MPTSGATTLATAVAAASSSSHKASTAIESCSSSHAPAQPLLPPSPPLSTRESIGRRLQIAVVVDLLTRTPTLKYRQLAWEDIQRAAAPAVVNCQHITFEKLDFGETAALDAFYNADVAIVDMSVRQQQAALCYHLGVREHMQQMYNLVILSAQDALANAANPQQQPSPKVVSACSNFPRSLDRPLPHDALRTAAGQRSSCRQ